MAGARNTRNAQKTARRANRSVVQKKARKAKVSGLRLNPVVAKLVDRRIHSSDTTHFKTFTGGVVNFDSSIGLTDFYNLLPAISQGDTVQDRSGDRIKLVSLTIKGYLKFVASGADNDDSYFVRHIVMSSKKYTTTGQLDADANRTEIANNLLKDGNDAVNFDGTWKRLHLPLNSAELTKHYDKVKLLKSAAVLAELVGGEGNVTTRTSVPIAIRPYTIRLKVKGKVLKYPEPNDQYPSNFLPILTHGFVNCNDPTNADTNNRVSNIYQVHMRWKDM